MLDYDETIIVLKDYARELNNGFIQAKQQDLKNYEAHFASNIILVLHKYKTILLLLNKIHKLDLLDSIESHKDKYLTAMFNSGFTQNQIDLYKTNILEISNFLKDSIKSNDNNSSNEQESNPLRTRMYKITNNIRLLMAQKNHNILANDYVQAFAIAYNIDLLNYDDQEDLLERLLLFKEIWSIQSNKESEVESVKYKFQHEVFNLINTDFKNSIDVTNQIIDLLLTKYITLPSLSDQQIINLYNHLRNYEFNCKNIVTLLDKVHEESRIRYSYNRPSESEYQLLNLFQNLDSLLFHQQKLEFGVINAYFLDKKNFLKHLIILLSEQVDNIRAFSLAKDKVLLSIIQIINSSFPSAESTYNSDKEALNKLTQTLSSFLETTIQKKYSNLDKYTFVTLVEKYQNLFIQIDYLLKNNDSSKLFLKEGLIKIITKEFHLPNLSNSVEKIRLVVLEKIKIREDLIILDLEEIFTKPEITNSVKDLDFKQISMNAEIKTSTEYIQAVLKKIITECSALQLNVLYKLSIESTSITHLQSFIKQEIKLEIKRRSSFVKMIIAILTGQKKEYDQLKNFSKKLHY
ncbi:MAG: hypothetical protein EKK61_02795 [Rickettsiales bacterium]|nr:MAG: hypothetical protein EKK61_02795 [Rickettsiales bacterium]